MGSPIRRYPGDPRKAFRRGPSKQAQQHRFGLIAGVVRGQNHAVAARDFVEAPVSQLACRFLDGGSRATRAAVAKIEGINPHDFDRGTPLFAESAHEGGIRVGWSAPQPVVNVSQAQVRERRPVMGQRPGEHRRIAASRNGDDDAPCDVAERLASRGDFSGDASCGSPIRFSRSRRLGHWVFFRQSAGRLRTEECPSSVPARGAGALRRALRDGARRGRR